MSILIADISGVAAVRLLAGAALAPRPLTHVELYMMIGSSYTFSCDIATGMSMVASVPTHEIFPLHKWMDLGMSLNSLPITLYRDNEIV